MVLVAPALAEERLGRGGRDVKWLPYHRFEIMSPLKREDAVAALAAHTEAPRWLRFDWPSNTNDKRFEGEVTANGFNLRRIMGYRNSFAPAVRGEIDSAGAMSRINITMQPSVFVLVFLAIWYLAVFGMFTAAGGFLGVAFLFALAPYLMVMGGFWFEANKQEKTLREILRAM
ncbi:MAG: hypothetical protein A4S17_04395 [Proteobacteria bacterium HN_bin10]|jgi:hypothetical protein|nr:MAG: hypothetical protein A4S17_04395 [Proteobacteria bacterium HN_bin10]